MLLCGPTEGHFGRTDPLTDADGSNKKKSREQRVGLVVVQKCRKIHGLDCENRAHGRARVTQPSPHIFMYVGSGGGG